jgi:hypothetical protein
MNNPNVRKAVEKGKMAHEAFKKKIDEKANWISNPFRRDKNGRVHIPDALSPSGRPVELKSNTPSGGVVA